MIRSFAVCHVALGALTLLACLFAPRPGAAVLLVPLGTHVSMPGAVQRLGGEVSLLGAGQMTGSLLVYPKRSLAIAPLLQNGILPIAVPSFLCSRSLPAS